MDQLFIEALGEVLYNNSINESSMSDDIAKWEPLLFPLIKKIYPDSLVEQIASVQGTKSPISKISYLNAIYSGGASNVDNNVHWTNSRLMTLPVSAQSSIVSGGTYTINSTPAVTGTVYYGEVTYEYTTVSTTAGLAVTTSVSAVPKYWNILVANIDSANLTTSNSIVGVVAGNTIGGVPIYYTTTNRNTIKKVFKDYSTVIEANTNLKQINFETATKTVATASRKIKSTFSQEKLQDLQALYKEKAYDIVAEAVANEIQQEIDREIIAFLKDSATPMASDINLPLSIAAWGGGGLDAITYDIYGSIYLAAEEIVKATKRNRTMFILADSATCAFLLLNPLHSEASPDSSNPYKVGKVGAYDLFCDPFSTEHYVIVGYNYVSKDKHDAGLYFTPYSTTVHETTSTDGYGAIPFSQNFMVMNRYGYTIHPQDSGTLRGGNSDFFRIFAVNFSYAGKVIPNFPEQFRIAY
jgi:hypothetical protein